MDAFWLAFGMLFIAELGDKTQLAALCLATQYKARVVLGGIFVATLVLHVISVGVGGGLGRLLSGDWLNLLAGLAFIAFGLLTLRGEGAEESCEPRSARSPFWMIASTFFLAEMGDKSMLSAMTLAAGNAFVPVWLGSTFGMVASVGLAILAGKFLGKRLPARAIQIGAAAIFFAFGLYRGLSGALATPWYGAVGAAVLLVGMLLWFVLDGRAQARASAVVPEHESPVRDLSNV